MEREGSLDTDAETELAHGERLVDTAATTGDYNALEHLDTFFVALDHAYVDLDGVPSLKLGDIVPKGLCVDEIGDVHRWLLRNGGRLGQSTSLDALTTSYNVTVSSSWLDSTL